MPSVQQLFLPMAFISLEKRLRSISGLCIFLQGIRYVTFDSTRP